MRHAEVVEEQAIDDDGVLQSGRFEPVQRLEVVLQRREEGDCSVPSLLAKRFIGPDSCMYSLGYAIANEVGMKRSVVELFDAASIRLKCEV